MQERLIPVTWFSPRFHAEYGRKAEASSTEAGVWSGILSDSSQLSQTPSNRRERILQSPGPRTETSSIEAMKRYCLDLTLERTIFPAHFALRVVWLASFELS